LGGFYYAKEKMPVSSVIRKLDENGDFHMLATYSLEPEKALIAYYMQQEKSNFNTWDYPEKIEAIRQYPSGSGYFYNKGDDVIYSRSSEAFHATS
jgi:hypothetical protein